MSCFYSQIVRVTEKTTNFSFSTVFCALYLSEKEEIGEVNEIRNEFHLSRHHNFRCSQVKIFKKVFFFLIHEFKNNYILFDTFNKVEFFIGKSKTYFLKKSRNTV